MQVTCEICNFEQRKQSIVNCLHTLFSFKCSQVNLEGFNATEVDDMIKCIAIG